MDGKGYLLNEPGAQLSTVYGDFSCKEEPEIDSPGGKRLPGPYGFWEKAEADGGWEILEAEPGKAFLLNQASRYSIESYQLFLCWGWSVDELWLLLTVDS